MSQRYLTIPLATVALVLTVFLLPLLQSPVLGLNIFSVTIILILLFGDTAVAFIAGCAGGFILDLTSAHLFGTMMIAHVVALMLTRLLFTRRITNRSLIAYVSLTAFGLTIIQLAAWCCAALGSLMSTTALGVPLSSAWILSVLYDVTRGLALALIVYVIVRITGHSYATLRSNEF